MGNLYDYFAAPSDEVAATAASDGPGLTSPQPFETVALRFVDPAVLTAVLEEILTGVPYEVVSNNPRCAEPVAIEDDGERMVVTVTDTLQTALASMEDSRVDEVAVAWSRAEEFGGSAEPKDIIPMLRGLAALARSAAGRGFRLYCWVSV